MNPAAELRAPSGINPGGPHKDSPAAVQYWGQHLSESSSSAEVATRAKSTHKDEELLGINLDMELNNLSEMNPAIGLKLVSGLILSMEV